MASSEVILTDEEAHKLIRKWNSQLIRSNGVELDPNDLEGSRGRFSGTLWHTAAYKGNVEMLEWLKSKGTGKMINSRNTCSETPLMQVRGKGGAAGRWLIEHGADVSHVSQLDETAFSKACQHCSDEYIEYLTPLVPREHLTLPDDEQITPEEKKKDRAARAERARQYRRRRW